MAEVRPGWLRLLILILIGLPPITGWPIKSLMHSNDSLHNILVWLIYGCFIWLFILLNVGAKSFLKYLSFAFTLALMTAFLGVIVRRLSSFFYEEISAYASEVSYKMILLLITMISVIPYSLFFINCFSASSMISKISFEVKGKHAFRIHLALALRVFQHVGDVVSNLLVAWKEENPLILNPRYKEEWQESKFSKLNWLKWFFNSILIWCFALLIHTLAAIPYLTEEMKSPTKKKNRLN